MSPYTEGPRFATVSHDDHGPILSILAWFLMVVFVLATLLKLTVRATAKGLGLDDVFLTFAMVRVQIVALERRIPANVCMRRHLELAKSSQSRWRSIMASVNVQSCSAMPRSIALTRYETRGRIERATTHHRSESLRILDTIPPHVSIRESSNHSTHVATVPGQTACENQPHTVCCGTGLDVGICLRCSLPMWPTSSMGHSR